jgi:hypothetical protein
MLEKLDTIDWSSLEDACGSAATLPDCIGDLASTDSDLQQDALFEVYDRIWHHGRVTEATPHAIAFLIELAEAGVLGEQLYYVLEMLYYLGDGPTPWYRKITNLKTYGEKEEGESLALLEREVGLSREAIDAIFEQAETYIEQSHLAVREGLPFYLHLLETNTDPQIREICAWLTVIFPERVEEIAPRLRQSIDQETDITVKTTLIWSLGRLLCKQGDRRYLSFFSGLAHSREHPSVYFYAAAAYASIARRETPPDIAALVATGIYWDWSPGDEPPLVTSGAILHQHKVPLHGCRALSSMGAERAVPVLLAVLDKLNRSEASDAYGAYRRFEPVIDALLDLAFGPRTESDAHRVRAPLRDGVRIRVQGRYYEIQIQREPVAARELTDLQYQTLAGIVAAQRLWEYEDNVYALYGLPTTRDGLRALLTSNPSHAD